jgi:hypothetical protein
VFKDLEIQQLGVNEFFTLNKSCKLVQIIKD